MDITQKRLEKSGLRLSTICGGSETYVNEDYSIRVVKCKNYPGWLVALVNNFGEQLSEEPFAESRIKVFSGYCETIDEINSALKACRKDFRI